MHGSGPGNAAGYAAVDFQPIDLALFWHGRRDIKTARVLLDRGAAYDLVIAAALGDLERVTAILDEDPSRVRESRPCGRRALSAAVELAMTASSDCCSTAAPIRTCRKGPKRPAEARCTLPHAPETASWWSCFSRTALIPTAISIRRAAPPTPPGRESCVRC